MVVYKVTNIVNGKSYIGCAVNYQKRINQHKSCKFKGAVLLHKAILKYGINSFSFEILQEFKTKEEMFKMEIFYIKEIGSLSPSGYNLHHGGKGGKIMLTEQQYKDRVELGKSLSKINIGNKYSLGRKASDSTKNKISILNKGKKMTEEAKAKISKANKGKSYNKGVIRSEEYKQKMSSIKKGVVFSDETKLKMSESAQKRVLTQKRNENGKFI